MSIFWKIIFWAILIFCLYHTFRDILQVSGVGGMLANFAHYPHQWCQQYCDYVAFPPEIAGIVASSIVLKRNRIGILGVVTIGLLLLIPLMFFIP